MSINIKITLNNESEVSIDRNYAITDGQLPEDMQENLQDMLDTLLDNTEVF